MRTLQAEPPFRIKEVPVKQNPTPRATDELGNPKHWVKKRIEKQRSMSGLAPPIETDSPRLNQSPQKEPDTATTGSRWSSPLSAREDVLSPSRISSHLPDLVDEEWLIECTGTSNLQEVDRLTLKIDTNLTTIERIGSYLPALHTLVLSNSRIASIRDLGTSLSGLMRLELSQCGIEGLDGIAALGGLRELFLSHNRVADTTPLAMHDHLELLDLSYNRVVDLSSVEMLATCPELHSLCLGHNPLWTLDHYRRLVGSSIPHLQVLDQKPVSAQERKPMEDELLAEAAETLKHFSLARPEQSSSVENSPGKGTQSRAGEVGSSGAEGGTDGDSKLTQQTGFFAGNPSSIRPRRRAQQDEGPRAWSGTILEVLDNPDRDIDITPTMEPEVRDWRSSEAIRGNPMLASLYDSMVDAKPQPQPQPFPSPPLHRLGGGQRSRSMPDVRRRRGEAAAEDNDGDGEGPMGMGEAHRQRTAGYGTPPLNLPMPVRLERRSDVVHQRHLQAGLSAQRRLRRRWSSSKEGVEDACDFNNASGASDGEDSGPEEGVVTRAVLNPKLDSEAQKAGVRMGFNLSESLAAIDQWIDEVDDDDCIVAHRTDILAKVPVRRRPATDSAMPMPSGARRPAKPRDSSDAPSSRPRDSRGLPSSTGSSSPSKPKKTETPAASLVPTPTNPAVSSAATSALLLDDDTLVRMLMRPPKSLTQLRTKESFRTFFRGMPADRMQRLLVAAYAGRDPEEVKDKVRKRLSLLQDVLC